MINTFTLPIQQKELTWGPIKVGMSLDLTAAHRSDAMRHLLTTALLAARVVTFDGQAAERMMMKMRDWDELDLDAFHEEVQRVEGERVRAFKKEQLATAGISVETCAMQVTMALTDLGNAFKLLIDTAQALESAGPLGLQKP